MYRLSVFDVLSISMVFHVSSNSYQKAKQSNNMIRVSISPHFDIRAMMIKFTLNHLQLQRSIRRGSKFLTKASICNRLQVKVEKGKLMIMAFTKHIIIRREICYCYPQTIYVFSHYTQNILFYHSIPSNNFYIAYRDN